jgi:hypothetical protein
VVPTTATGPRVSEHCAHTCALGESRKISVGVVMIFPFQKTHFSDDIDAKACEPNY